MSEITGVTFPVPKHLMPRFFAEGKTVFIKPATVFKDLRSGMRLVFGWPRERLIDNIGCFPVSPGVLV